MPLRRQHGLLSAFLALFALMLPLAGRAQTITPLYSFAGVNGAHPWGDLSRAMIAI